MAVVTEELISDLIVRDGKLRSGIRSAQQAYGAGIGSMRNDTKRFESEFNKSADGIASGFKDLAATLAAGVSVAGTISLIDSYTRLQNALKIAGLEGKNLESVQNDLLALSTRYGVNVEGLANLYGKATDAGRSFGASQAEVLKLTEATSQALLISGTGAEEASGAILGLSQALASGTVRAEEYNQINEGGLRPLLQAAAAADRFGGDINKLRAAMIDGKLSSEEFFNSIMAGSAQLESQASKATLTLSGAFEALNSALTVYVGEAAASSGVSAALAAGILTLAENLDTLVNVLAVIAAVIGTRYLVALGGTVTATVALSIANGRAAQTQAFLNAVMASGAATQNIYASSVVRTTTTLATVGIAARGAGAALLAAFGGPVGVAILALGAGLVYVATRTYEAARANGEYAKQTAVLGEIQRKVTDATDALATATGRARAEAIANAKALQEETKQYLANARAAIIAAAAKASETRQAAVAAASQASGGGPGEGVRGRISGSQENFNRARREAIQADANAKAAESNVIKAMAEMQRLQKIIDGAAPPAINAGGKPDTKKTRTGGGGADPAEQERQRAFREAQDLRGLQIEELRAKEELAATAKERAEFQRQTLELERAGRLAEINEAVRRKDLTAQEGEARRAIIENLYGAGDEIKVQSRESAYEERITREQKRDAERDRADIAQTELDNRRDELQFSLDMAETQAERRRIALQILEAETETRRLALEGIKATEAINSAKYKQADAELKQLDVRAGRDAQRIGRDTENPLEKLSRESNLTADQMNEAFQSIEADGLTALSDGITDVIMQTRSLGDVFKSVANQIIADLIRIAVQKFIVNSLVNIASSAFGGGGGFGGSSLGGGLAGARAGGGPVRAGQLYRVNEGQQEFFRPATDGRVVPLSQAQAARPAASAMQGPTIVQLAVAPGEMFVPIVEGISGNVAVRTVQATAPGLVRAATNETMRRAGRPRT